MIGVWCAYSLVGGFVFGALRHTPSTLLLVGGLAAFTMPLALVGGGWWWLLAALIPAGLLCAPSLASTVDTVSTLVPPSARGEAMGLHGSALTVGIATGAPAAGWVIDAVGPGWGFVLAGAVGAASSPGRDAVLAEPCQWQTSDDLGDRAAPAGVEGGSSRIAPAGA